MSPEAQRKQVASSGVWNAEVVSALMQGGIDVHIHANPHIFPDSHALDVIDLARKAGAAGMRALAVKDLGGTTTGAAYVVSRLDTKFPVYGTHVMNISAGGLSPRAVWAALTHGDGARVVHFPAGDSRNHFEYRKRFYAGTALPLTEDEAITVAEDGKLLPVVREIISLIKEYDACMATCHLSAAESHLVVDEAINQGVKRIVISHANWAMTRLTKDDLKDFAQKGCFLEFECAQVMPMMQIVHGETPANPRQIVELVNEVGTERCFLSSDLGQIYSPDPVEGMRAYIAALMKCGLASNDIRTMFHSNPAEILGL